MIAVVGLGAGCAGGGRSGTRKVTATGQVRALLGGRIYPSPDASPIDDGVVLVRDGLIQAVGPRGSLSLPSDASIVDCSTRVILSGFWNSHVHFTEPHWSGADTLPADSLTQMRSMLTRYGFVRVLDTGSWLANTLALRHRMQNGEVAGPAILTTGPGFVPQNGSPFYILPDRLPELASPGAAKDEVAARLQAGADAIKLFTGSVASPTRVVPMPLPVVRAATAEAHRAGRLVIAHPTNLIGLARFCSGPTWGI